MKKKELSYGFQLLVNLPRSLLLYLFSRNLLHTFIERAKSDQRPSYLLALIVKTIPEKCAFIDAFTWSTTPEGYDFWYEKYLEYCKINNLFNH